MVVSFSGPAVNMVIAAACFLLIATTGLIVRILAPDSLVLNSVAPLSPVAISGVQGAHMLAIHFAFMKQFFYTALAIGLFNLMPIPPLDGAGILKGLLSPLRAAKLMRFHSYIPIFFVVFMVLFYILIILLVSVAASFLSVTLMAMGYR